MDREYHEYRGWKLCVVSGRTCLGQGKKTDPPHDVITATGITPAAVLKELRRQVDAADSARRDPPRG